MPYRLSALAEQDLEEIWVYVEVVEMIDVLSECGPGFGDGWEAGILSAYFEKRQ